MAANRSPSSVSVRVEEEEEGGQGEWRLNSWGMKSKPNYRETLRSNAGCWLALWP